MTQPPNPDPIDTTPTLATATLNEIVAEIERRCESFVFVCNRTDGNTPELFHYLSGSVSELLGLVKWIDMETQKIWIEDRIKHDQ